MIRIKRSRKRRPFRGEDLREGGRMPSGSSRVLMVIGAVVVLTGAAVAVLWAIYG